MPKITAWLRPAAGGVLLGGLLLALPELYGVGYPVLEWAIQGRYLAGSCWPCWPARCWRPA